MQLTKKTKQINSARTQSGPLECKFYISLNSEINKKHCKHYVGVGIAAVVVVLVAATNALLLPFPLLWRVFTFYLAQNLNCAKRKTSEKKPKHTSSTIETDRWYFVVDCFMTKLFKLLSLPQLLLLPRLANWASNTYNSLPSTISNAMTICIHTVVATFGKKICESFYYVEVIFVF